MDKSRLADSSIDVRKVSSASTRATESCSARGTFYRFEHSTQLIWPSKRAGCMVPSERAWIHKVTDEVGASLVTELNIIRPYRVTPERADMSKPPHERGVART